MSGMSMHLGLALQMYGSFVSMVMVNEGTGRSSTLTVLLYRCLPLFFLTFTLG